MSVEIEQLDVAGAEQALPALVEVLVDAVDGGASVSFLPPLDPAEATNFWQGVVAALQQHTRILLVARANGAIVGTVQLDLAQQPNGRHRAEVLKLLVHSSARRQGIGSALMQAIEPIARREGRSLLVLDTLRGHDGERLYRSLGYHEVGQIPQFARLADGHLYATVVFYKLL